MTDKKISDYLHLYLGCEVRGTDGTMTYTLSSVSKKQVLFTDEYRNEIWLGQEWKLALRRLSDMTEEEYAELWPLIGGAPHLFAFGAEDLRDSLESGDWSETGFQMDYYTMSCMLNYLRKIGIDCDDLIDSGLAIDRNTLTNSNPTQ
jgi:hypothetical protein